MKRKQPKIICWLWGKIWQHWIREDEYVDKVIGWRTMRIKNKSGNVKCMTPCFWFFD
jgi:hypothetical protein